LIICEVGQNHAGNMDIAKILIQEAVTYSNTMVKFQLYSHEKIYGDEDVPNCELSFDQAKLLFNFGKDLGIEVFFSVFDLERIEWCEEIGVKRYKIAYDYKDNEELVKAVRDTKKPVIISGIDYLCVPKYPASMGEYMLHDWSLYKGVSDHTVGMGLAKLCIAKRYDLEKHFAIDHKVGVDAEWSMTPQELRELVKWQISCRNRTQSLPKATSIRF